VREEIASKLEDLKKYAAFLESKKSVSAAELSADPVLSAAVERFLQVALECCLEVGEMIISMEGFSKPQSYRDVFRILGDEGVLPKKFAKKIEPAAGLRNILVPHYSEIDTKRIHQFLRENLGDFSEYAKHTAKYAKQKKSGD